MNTNTTPKISVITPCLNGAKYIEQAIQSVLAQDYSNFEHVVADGGSTDGTLDILKKYPHIKWASEPDKGQSDAMNKGFAMSTGEIIVYLNADDFFEPGAFKTAVRYLDKEKGSYFVVGECHTIGADGRIILGGHPIVTFYGMLQWWKNSVPLNPVAYFYYREVQEKVGGFDDSNHYAMDYDFLLKAAYHFELRKIDAVLGTFRLIPGTKTHQSIAEGTDQSMVLFARKYWRRLPPGRHIRVWFSWLYYVRLKIVRTVFGWSLHVPYRAVRKAFRLAAQAGRPTNRPGAV